MKTPRTGPSLLVLLALLPIVLLTLGLPGDPPAALSGGGPTGPGFWCVACSERGSADFILNLLLFAPFGAALRLTGIRSGWVAIVALGVSGAVETAQLGLAGRHSSVSDLMANTGGAWAGGMAASVLSGLPRRAAPALLVGAMLLAVLLVAAWFSFASWAFHPSLQDRPYYGQWTPGLGHYETYRGEVVSARVGGHPVPSWRLGDSGAVRESLLRGDTLRVTAVAGPPPAELAPIFSIYDDRQHEVLVLGADGSDVVLRVRRRAADLRLGSPELRWEDALLGVTPGDTIRLATWRDGRSRFCLISARAVAPPDSWTATTCRTPSLLRSCVLLLGP